MNFDIGYDTTHVTVSANGAQLHRVLAERSFPLLKQLATQGKLFWRGQKIVVDPFTTTALSVEMVHSYDALLLKASWHQGARQGSLSQCAVFTAGWMILHAILYPLDTAPYWAKLLYPEGCVLTGAEGARCLEQLQKDPPGPVHCCSDADAGPIPLLSLTDRHGAFANLGFDYGAFGAQPFWRSIDKEKEWEHDLLETDFIKKWGETSHYYCPLNKVSKSLTFLLEIGWKIFDCRGKRVLRQKKEELTAHMSADHFLVRGTIHYETHAVDLKNLVGAFNRKERFIDLSDRAVGLLDAETMEKYENLSQCLLLGDAVAVPKECVGLLSDFWTELPTVCQYEERALPPTFVGQLFPYQEEGVRWLEFLRQSGYSGLLADEMGLGKTVQIVAFFTYLSLDRPSLIVVPTSLLFNWKREFERFFPTCPLYVHEKRGPLDPHPVILTTYALLRLDVEEFQKHAYQLIVLDEAQTIKNPDSQIARVACSLNSGMRLAVTGTPIENRLEDLWSLFHFLAPSLLDSREIHLPQMKKKVRPFLLRRKKEQVGLQLPPKMEQLVWVDMGDEQRALYDSFLRRARAGFSKKKASRMDVLEVILRLRQLCVHPWLVENPEIGDFFSLSGKCERLFLDLQEVIDEGKKVLVYSQFTTLLHLICREVANRGWRHVYLDGQTADREGVVRQFQDDPTTQLFLISLKAGGVGLNLTAADYVFLCDPWWNDAVEQQAIDRAHRLGRTSSVIARRYVTALSIEEKIIRLKEHKSALAQGLFDEDGAAQSLSLEELMQLILV